MKYIQIHKFFIALIVFFFFQKQCMSQRKFSSKEEKELIVFMNYVRDSILKINTWGTRLYFKNISGSRMFGEPNYFEVWRDKMKRFDKKDIASICREILDTSACPLTEKMLRMSFAKPERMSYNFFQLKEAKSYIDYYGLRKDSISRNCLKEINISYDSSIDDNRNKIVKEYAFIFNKNIKQIKHSIAQSDSAYRYFFAKPIFLKNYKYCVLIYSDEGVGGSNSTGYILVFRKTHKEWHLYRPFVKDFPTSVGWSDGF